MAYTGPVYQRSVADRSAELISGGYQALAAGVGKGLSDLAGNVQKKADKREMEAVANSRFDIWKSKRPELASEFEEKFYGGSLGSKTGILHELETLGAREDAKPQYGKTPGGGGYYYNPKSGSMTPEKVFNPAPLPREVPNPTGGPVMGMEDDGRVFPYPAPPAEGQQTGWYTDPKEPDIRLHPSGAKLDLRKAETKNGLRIVPIEGMDGYGMLMNGNEVADKQTMYKAEEMPGTGQAAGKVKVPLFGALAPGLNLGLDIPTPAKPPKRTWKPTQLELDGRKAGPNQQLVKRRTKDTDGIVTEEFFTFNPKTGELTKAEPSLFPGAEEVPASGPAGNILLPPGSAPAAPSPAPAKRRWR